MSIRWCSLVVLLCCLAAASAQQHQQKRAIDDSPERIQLADSLIAQDKTRRQSTSNRPTPRPLGFFGTIWKLLVDQVNDTRSGYDQLSVILGNQFSDTQRPTTKKPITDNSTTTTEAPPRLSRQEFLDIIRRNLIGLRRLYNLEVREAWSDSKKNIQDYQREFHKKLYEQFKD